MVAAHAANMALNLLLVEDDLSFARSEQTLLESLGYSVTVCSNAKASMTRLLDERFDLILLDLCLGSSSLAGLGVIQSLRQLGLKVPPIVITSGNDKALIQWAAAKIQTPYWLQKPFSADELARTIETASPVSGAPVT